MAWQNIIVYLAVAGCMLFVSLKLRKAFVKKKADRCTGCSGDCRGCGKRL